MILSNHKERLRFMRFAIVGAIGALVDFGVMNLLSHFTPMPLVVAGTISFTCAVVSNFTWNRYWTYPESRSRPLLHQLVMFFVVNTAGVLIRLPILHFVEPFMLRVFEDTAHLSHLSADFLARNGTLALAIGVVMLWNYFINRHWTYNDVE
ncbi:MAG: GtrA family protein [Chloroflexota bacterium]